MAFILKARLERVEISAAGFLSLVAVKQVVDEDTGAPLAGASSGLHRQTGQAASSDPVTPADTATDLLRVLNDGLLQDGYPPISADELAQVLSIAHG